MSSRDEYIEIIKQAFVTLGRKAVVEFITAQFPFFATSVGTNIVLPFVSLGAGMAVEAIVTKAEMAAFFLYIDMRSGQQGRDFEKAALENYRIQQTGEPWEKANAEKVLRAALAKLVVFTA